MRIICILNARTTDTLVFFSSFQLMSPIYDMSETKTVLENWIGVTLLIAQVFQHYFDVMWLLAPFDSSDFFLFLDTVGIVSKKFIRKMVIQKDGHLWWSHGQIGQWTLLDEIYLILGQWYAFLLYNRTVSKD